MKKVTIAIAILLSGCATVVDKEMQVAQALIASEAQSAENLICKMIPIGTWMVMYGNSPARADGWSKICNAPSASPIAPKVMP